MFTVEHHGSIVLIRPEDEASRQQLTNICSIEDWQWFGGALAVEPRYADVIVEALDRGEGL